MPSVTFVGHVFSKSSALRSPFGLSRPWILGPGVFRVATTEFASHDWVAVVPEGFQVVSDLLRPVVGGQQMQQQRDATSGDAGSGLPAEDFLNPDRENRRSSLLILNRQSVTAWNRDMSRGFSIERLSLVRKQFGLQQVWPGSLSEFCK